MILHAYGDSWTEGQGCNRLVEDSLSKEERPTYRKENSWVKFLADKLNMPFINNAVSGNANNKIFNQIVSDIQSEKIKSGDFVTIMWSSSLRDYVPFLPDGEWVTWSVKHLIEEPHKFINSYNSSNTLYDSFFTEYKEFFIGEMFNQNYYNIVNQNYIIFIQKLFKHYNINYIMCDSFESMLIDLDKKDNITHLIDNSKYWEFNKQTFRDYLNKIKRLDIWENQDEQFETRASQHPNLEGYKLISEELYGYIKNNKIL